MEMTEAMKAKMDGIKQNLDKVMNDLEPRIKSLEEHGKGAAELKEEVAKINLDTAKRYEELQKEMTDRMDEIEVKAKEMRDRAGQSTKTAGQLFVESDAFKSAPDRTNSPFVTIEREMAMKSVTSSASQNRPDYLSEMVRPQNTNLAMRDLIPGGRSSRDSVVYPKLTGRATAAARVAPGAEKPPSSLTFVDATANMHKLAHWIPVTEEQLSDIEGLRSLIDAELRYGIEKVEDTKFLHGTGGANDIHGIVPQATAYAPATYGNVVATPTRVDHLRGMYAQLQVADYTPSGFVLNPLDWFLIETTKTTQGAYIFAQPQGLAGQRMWGLPVVATNQMTAGTALIGDFRIGAQLFDGQFQGVYGIQIKTGQPNAYFLENRYAILAEERVALAVKRPDAFVAGPIQTGEIT